MKKFILALAIAAIATAPALAGGAGYYLVGNYSGTVIAGPFMSLQACSYGETSSSHCEYRSQ